MAILEEGKIKKNNDSLLVLLDKGSLVTYCPFTPTLVPGQKGALLIPRFFSSLLLNFHLTLFPHILLPSTIKVRDACSGAHAQARAWAHAQACA